ncbi:MAG: multicopper oxidase family protein [Pseudomonadota bacterium]|nr:multicopper oxidase family protein [Pseudomonadota bacterium]
MKLSRREVLKLSAALPFLGQAQAEALPVLDIVSRVLEVKGKAAKVFGIIGPEGKPGLSLVYGQPFRALLRNRLSEATAIHWHGLTPPVAFDGVPMLVGEPLAAGESRTYDFVNKKTGTHWMHSHLGLQEQQLLAAPLIVHETEKPVFDDQEHVVMLHDFTFRDSAEILAELKSGGGGHAAHMKMDGMTMGGMAMGADIKYDALLANDRTLNDPEIVNVEKGGRLRLRLINAASATNMWVELGALKGLLIAVDGNAVKPISIQRFPLAIAQRADVRITLPNESGAWPIVFQSEGDTLRGGIVLKAGAATVAKLSNQGKAGAALDLTFEATLRVPYPLHKSKLEQHETVRLTGGDDHYEWGFNGRPMMHDLLFKVKHGTRVEVTMRNETTMAHPMHLHGHYFQVTEINGVAVDGAQRDTVLVPSGAQVRVQFEADNPGLWAFHCHHLYHMNSGMMAAMGYQGVA